MQRSITSKPDQAGNRRGFTIVELLIVIVVIGILAAITIVAYNGIQQRANNTAIIDSASSSLRMIESYIAVNGTYPLTVSTGVGGACITTTAGCSLVGTNTVFGTNMATIGTLPRSVPISGTGSYGLNYVYTSDGTFNGAPQPATLIYWLSGINQQCGVSGVANGAWGALAPSTTGYTYGNDTSTGKTLCSITIPGPSA
jgi:prepilin-type N-terminal cleavage/methylation domain-containing protein